jgi:hypothetical protein
MIYLLVVAMFLGVLFSPMNIAVVTWTLQEGSAGRDKE